MNEERKKKMLKQQEIDAKRMLDIQMLERKEQQRLRRYEDSTDAVFIKKEVRDFEEIEKKK